MFYDNYEKYPYSFFNIVWGVPLRSYYVTEDKFFTMPNTGEWVYDVLTYDRRVLRGIRFIPFNYKKIFIDFKLRTVEDFENTTQELYKNSQAYDGYQSIDDLDIFYILDVASSYINQNGNSDLIPDVVLIMTLRENIAFIINAINPTISFRNNRTSLDPTNQNPNTLDSSNSSSNYVRLYIGNAAFIINEKTGDIVINNVGSSNITINSSNQINTNSNNDTNINSKGDVNISIPSDNKVRIGSSSASDPAVLGNELKNTLTDIKTTLSDIQSLLSKMSTQLGGPSNSPVMGNSGAYTTDVTNISTDVTTVGTDIDKILSKNVTLV